MSAVEGLTCTMLLVGRMSHSLRYPAVVCVGPWPTEAMSSLTNPGHRIEKSRHFIFFGQSCLSLEK